MMEIKLTLDATPALLDALAHMTGALAGAMGAPAGTISAPAGATGALRGLSTPAQRAQQATAQTSTAPAPIVPQQSPAAQVPATNVVPMPAPAVPMPAPVAPPVSPAPLSEPDYTHEQLGRAAAAYMDKAPGNQAQLINLLQQFGVQAITHLTTPAQRTAFANGLRGLGAKV